MKNFILLLILLFSFSNLSAKTLVVTDIDDTIKYTNVLDKSDAIYNALFSKREFSGMSELFQEFNKSGAIIYYVSGSPQLISSKVDAFLAFNHFPQSSHLFLKGLEHTYDFKLRTITSLINKIKPDKIILIGDDTEYDPEVYSKLSEDFNVERILIHSIQNREVPRNPLIRTYFSSVEIAGVEQLEGNLKMGSLERVSLGFIAQNNEAQVVIPGRFCPREGSLLIEELKHRMPSQNSINALELVQREIIKTCSK